MGVRSVNAIQSEVIFFHFPVRTYRKVSEVWDHNLWNARCIQLISTYGTKSKNEKRRGNQQS